MGMRMPNVPRDPQKEEEEKKRAKALSEIYMQEGGWHPPMPWVAPMNAQPMANPQPRDFELSAPPPLAGPLGEGDIDRGKISAYLGRKMRGSVSPDEIEMRVERASQPDLQQMPARGKFVMPGDMPSENPSTETLVEDPGLEAQDYSSPSSSFSQPMASDPLKDKDARIAEYLEKSLMGPRQRSDLPYGDLLMRSAAQIGTLGGKSADTQPFTDFTKNLMSEESTDDARRFKILEYLRSKNAAKDKAAKDYTFDREKLASDSENKRLDRELKAKQVENESKKLDFYYQNLLNQASNQAEANRINAEWRAAQAEVSKMNAESMKSLREAQTENLSSRAGDREKERELKKRELALKERDLSLKENQPPQAKLSEGKRKYVADLEGKAAAQAANLNLLQSYLEEFRNAKTMQDKVRVAGMMAKPLNGLAGQDAVGVEEVNRIMEAIQPFSAGRVWNMENPFGRDLPGFERQVQSVIQTAKNTVLRNQKEIENITQGSGSIGDTLSSPSQQLPESKPDVMQNGFIYKWNPETGRYE